MESNHPHLTRKKYMKMLTQWTKKKPTFHERTLMKKKCAPLNDCFLGTRKSFPICTPDCKINKGAIMSAYIRAKEMYSRSKTGKIRKHKPYYYKNIANKAKKLLNSM